MPRAGEVWLVDLPNAIGHQQGGIRPVLITSNNVGNYYSPVFEGVSLTSKKQENSQPTHAFYRAGEAGLKDDSVLLAEQKWTINKSQLIKKIGVMNDDQLLRAVTAIAHANPIYLLAYEAGVQNTPTFKRLAMAQ
jgi:mRNA interferase MazF